MLSTERVGLFHVPILMGKCDIPHKEIELHVREKMMAQDTYTSYYDAKLNQEITRELPHREAMEKVMRDISMEFLEMRGGDLTRYAKTKPSYWFSVYTTNEEHCLHVHPRTHVAGTYYPYADEDSSPIRFRCPYSTAQHMGEPHAAATKDWHFHYPRTGEINVWPPWLEHQIRPNNNVDESRARIAISFNFGQ